MEDTCAPCKLDVCRKCRWSDDIIDHDSGTVYLYCAQHNRETVEPCHAYESKSLVAH